jgi:hypothetical protein
MWQWYSGKEQGWEYRVSMFESSTPHFFIKIGLTLRENILFNQNIHTNPCHRFS